MTDRSHSIPEEELGAVLTAYLDGELAASKVREVEEILARHEPARRLLARLEAVSPVLPKLYQSVLDETVPDRLVAAIESYSDDEGGAEVVPLRPQSPRRSVLTRLAASVALLAAGGAGGFLARDHLMSPAPPPTAARPSWVDLVAEYHSVYGKEQRHLVEVGAEEIDHIRAWLGKRLDRQNLIADLTPFGLEFKGARLLVINGQHVAQLMYLAERGRPVGFCIIRSPKEDAPLKAHRRDDLNLVTWRNGGYGFIVVGWDEADHMRAIAEAAADQMASA